MEEKKEANIVIKYLCFCIPLLGLILYLSNESKNKLYAKQCGKSALIGLIVQVVIILITMGLITHISTTMFRTISLNA